MKVRYLALADEIHIRAAAGGFRRSSTNSMDVFLLQAAERKRRLYRSCLSRHLATGGFHK